MNRLHSNMKKNNLSVSRFLNVLILTLLSSICDTDKSFCKFVSRQCVCLWAPEGGFYKDVIYCMVITFPYVENENQHSGGFEYVCGIIIDTRCSCSWPS